MKELLTALVGGFMGGLTIGLLYAWMIHKMTQDRVQDMQRMLIARNALSPATATAASEDPSLPQRPSDEDVPEELVEICMLFPQDGTRMLREARLEHSRGTPWKILIAQYREYINMQNPDALTDLLPGGDKQADT